MKSYYADQFRFLNPGRCLSSWAFLSRLNSSFAIKIWITTTMAVMQRWPRYIINAKPPIIQIEEYARTNIDLYLLRSLTSKLPPFVLLTSGTACSHKGNKMNKYYRLNLKCLHLIQHMHKNFNFFGLQKSSKQKHILYRNN